MNEPNLRVIRGRPEIPTAREIAAHTWNSGVWRSADGRDLITYLTDELGPDDAAALLRKADDYLTRIPARRGHR